MGQARGMARKRVIDVITLGALRRKVARAVYAKIDDRVCRRLMKWRRQMDGLI